MYRQEVTRKEELTVAISQVTPLHICLVKIIVDLTVQSEITLWQDINKLVKSTQLVIITIPVPRYLPTVDELDDAVFYGKKMHKEVKDYYSNKLSNPFGDYQIFTNYFKDSWKVRNTIKTVLSYLKDHWYSDYYKEEINDVLNAKLPEYP